MASSTDSSSSGDDESGEQTVSEEEVESEDEEQQQSVEPEDEEQQQQQSVDDKQRQSVPVPKPKPKPVSRPRKPKRASKWPIDMIEVTEIRPDGKPVEEREVRRLRLLARLIARQHISLVMPSFRNMKTEAKWALFDKHVMPYLKFSDTKKTEGFKYMIKVISKSWRTHKNRLVTDFIQKDISPLKKHPYIEPEDWEEFVALKKSQEEVDKSDKYKNLRGRSVHNHRLGSTGYDGMEKKWEAEDALLAERGIPNPWDQYPEGRPMRFLRARSKLEISEDTAVIVWKQDPTQKVSEEMKEKQAAAEASGITWVRENDVLTACLGPEQPGRVRGVSSYTPWKHGYVGYDGMYRKRKRSDVVDVEAITARIREDVTAQVTEEVTAKVTKEVTKEVTSKVTKDVMSYLASQGLLVRPPPSRTPSPACGRRSSCASASNAAANDLESPPFSFPPDTIDVLEEPTPCSLAAVIPGYDKVVVAEGRVFPKEFELESVQIGYDYAIVQVECVYEGYEEYMLQPPRNDDIRTLREAILQRIQWRRDWIIVKYTHETKSTQSQPDDTTKSALKGTNAIISTQLLRGANSAPSNHQSPATSDATKSVPKENVAANPSKNPKSSEKECTKQPTKTKVGIEAVQSSAKPPKQQKGASKAARESGKAATNKKWLEKYKCGHPFLPSMDLKALGPKCAALHDHYMKDCINNEHGIKVRFRGIYMLTSSDFELGLVRYNFLYDFFHFGALDSSILQCWTLSLVVEAKAKHIPVGILDPQMMSVNNIKFDRDKVVQYVHKAFTKFTKDDYIIFAHNSGGSAGGHWIVVIVIQKWDKVIYLDSNKSGNNDFSMLKLVIDEAFARHTSTLKDRPKPLKHKFKYACLQQKSVNSSSWYAAHHLSVAMRQTNLECSEEFEVLTKPIDMHVIREQLAKFLVEHVINKKGEFHHHQ